MTIAMCDIVSGYQKVLLELAIKKAKEEHTEEAAEEIAAETVDGSEKRKTPLGSVLARIR